MQTCRSVCPHVYFSHLFTSKAVPSSSISKRERPGSHWKERYPLTSCFYALPSFLIVSTNRITWLHSLPVDVHHYCTFHTSVFTFRHVRTTDVSGFYWDLMWGSNTKWQIFAKRKERHTWKSWPIVLNTNTHKTFQILNCKSLCGSPTSVVYCLVLIYSKKHARVFGCNATILNFTGRCVPTKFRWILISLQCSVWNFSHWVQFFWLSFNQGRLANRRQLF